jgi:hypothetical protein
VKAIAKSYPLTCKWYYIFEPIFMNLMEKRAQKPDLINITYPDRNEG